MSAQQKVLQPFPAPEFAAYEAGKKRRYELLFSVNGGAFAIAKLFADANASKLLGNLTLQELAIGMVLFTAIMGFDTWTFGMKMKDYLGDAVFGKYGKAVLVLIVLLIMAGWLLVVL